MYGDDIWLSVEILSWMHGTNTRHLLLRNNAGYVSDDMACCLWDN
jgi:hypothetical protein